MSGVHGSGMTARIISNKEMEDVMKIIEFLVDSGLLTRDVTQIIQNETIEQAKEFFKLVIVYFDLDRIFNAVSSLE